MIFVRVEIQGFQKFLWIEIPDGSGGFLSSGSASGSKSPDDWGRMWQIPQSVRKYPTCPKLPQLTVVCNTCIIYTIIPRKVITKMRFSLQRDICNHLNISALGSWKLGQAAIFWHWKIHSNYTQLYSKEFGKVFPGREKMPEKSGNWELCSNIWPPVSEPHEIYLDSWFLLDLS